MTPPARAAREAAGLTLAAVAARVRRSPAYLAALERTGRFPYPLARRLAVLYGAPLTHFLPTRGCPGTGTKGRPLFAGRPPRSRRPR